MQNNDVGGRDFSKYRVSTPNNPPKSNANSIQKPFNPPASRDLSKYRVQAPESTIESGIRHGGRTASRFLETAIGTPGSFIEFLNEGIASGAEKISGKELPELRASLKDTAPSKLLPTIQSLRKLSESATGGYTQPKGEGERKWDEGVELLTALSVPQQAPLRWGNFLKNIGTTVGTKLIGEGSEKFGASEKQRGLIETGTLFLTGLFNPQLANQYKDKLYKKAEDAVPKNTMVPSQSFVKKLDDVEQALSKGVSTPTKEAALGPLREIRNKASGGAVPFDEVKQAYHDINELKSTKNMFDMFPKKDVRQAASRRLDLVKDAIGDAIDDYGKFNPEFLENWRKGNLAYKTIADSKQVSDFISRHINKLPAHMLASTGLDYFLGYPIVTGTTLGAYPLLKVGELGYRFAKNKDLQNLYLKFLREASLERAPSMISTARQLDKAIREDERKNQ